MYVIVRLAEAQRLGNGAVSSAELASLKLPALCHDSCDASAASWHGIQWLGCAHV